MVEKQNDILEDVLTGDGMPAADGVGLRDSQASSGGADTSASDIPGQDSDTPRNAEEGCDAEEARDSPVADEPNVQSWQSDYMVKTCPRCGAQLFEDMDICYGCLYDFSRSPKDDHELPACENSPFFAEGSDARPIIDRRPFVDPDEAVPTGERPSKRAGFDVANPAGTSTVTPVELTVPVEAYGLAGMQESVGAPVQDSQGIAGLREGVQQMGQQSAAAASSAVPNPVASAGPYAATIPPAATDPDATTVLNRVVESPITEIRVEMGDSAVRIPLEGRAIYVGRDKSCDVVINRRIVSRRHICIYKEAGSVICKDLGATNPARINGSILKGARSIGQGAVIDVCGMHFIAA